MVRVISGFGVLESGVLMLVQLLRSQAVEVPRWWLPVAEYEPFAKIQLIISYEAIKMKCFCSVSILALIMFGNVSVFADDGSLDKKNAEDKPRAQRFRPGDPENGDRRPGQRRPGQFAGGFSPEQMVQRMLEEFDADGDKKLNADELQKMMTTMRERRGGGMQRRPGGNGRPSSGNSNATPGGEQPKRPSATE